MMARQLQLNGVRCIEIFCEYAQRSQNCDALFRVNYDTDHDLVARAVSRVLLNGADAQIIVTFDALDTLFRLFPALRAANALLAANERLEAPVGDRVLFTRGGSFRWTDHLLESRTSLLTSTEIIDAGIVPDDENEDL